MKAICFLTIALALAYVFSASTDARPLENQRLRRDEGDDPSADPSGDPYVPQTWSAMSTDTSAQTDSVADTIVHTPIPPELGGNSAGELDGFDIETVIYGRGIRTYQCIVPAQAQAPPRPANESSLATATPTVDNGQTTSTLDSSSQTDIPTAVTPTPTPIIKGKWEYNNTMASLYADAGRLIKTGSVACSIRANVSEVCTWTSSQDGSILAASVALSFSIGSSSENFEWSRADTLVASPGTWNGIRYAFTVKTEGGLPPSAMHCTEGNADDNIRVDFAAEYSFYAKSA